MKSTTWPFIQKDEKGDLILYPAFFSVPIKGYIIPDEKVKKDFIFVNVPICLIGFILLLHTTSFYSFAIVFILILITLYLVQYIFLKKYPVSKRKYSWRDRFAQMNKEHSKIGLLGYTIIWFSASMAIAFLLSSGHLYLDVAGTLIFGYLFILFLFALIYRTK